MTPDVPNVAIVETQIIELTNRYRAKHNLGTLKMDPGLRAAARNYSRFLTQSSDLSHTADGRSAGERVSDAGYAWCHIGENLLAMDLVSTSIDPHELAKKSVEGWMNSPSHRENLLTPEVTETGVAVAAESGGEKYIAVQLFARPKSLEISFQISNSSRQTVTYTFNGKDHALKPATGVLHTACLPDEIVFRSGGGRTNAKPVAGRFAASDGVVYVVKPDDETGVRIDVEQRHTID